MLRPIYLAAVIGWWAVLGTAPVLARPPCTWVTTSAEVSLEQRSMAEARWAALGLARYTAVATVGRGYVTGRTTVRDMVPRVYVQALAAGYLLEERATFAVVPSQPAVGLSPAAVYRADLDACVVPKPARNAEFILRAALNQDLFLDGDRSAQLTLSCSQDCYLTIFNHRATDQVVLLYEERYHIPPLLLKAKESLLFPPQGMRLRMQLPEGHSKAPEYFVVVATTRPYDFRFLLQGRTQVSLYAFNQALLSVPQMEVTEVVLPYEIRRRGEP